MSSVKVNTWVMTIAQSVKVASLSGTYDITNYEAHIEDEEFDFMDGIPNQQSMDLFEPRNTLLSWTPPNVVWTSFYPMGDPLASPNLAPHHSKLHPPSQSTCQSTHFHIRLPRPQEHYNPDTILQPVQDGFENDCLPRTLLAEKVNFIYMDAVNTVDPSSPAPEPNVGPVKAVVANNYKEIMEGCCAQAPCFLVRSLQELGPSTIRQCRRVVQGPEAPNTLTTLATVTRSNLSSSSQNAINKFEVKAEKTDSS
ncbi:MAG: hypothetical protein J3Q66DRAFT_445001 [Benniella sp.]|nr:MAG: hypothetical protein J3Q66DRAFT_445001 [Benniella sp.]